MRNIIPRIISFAILLGFSQNVFTQEIPFFTHYAFNRMLYNPAVVGAGNQINFATLSQYQYLNFRDQTPAFFGLDSNQNVFKQVYRYENDVLTDIESYKNNKKDGVFKEISNGKIESSKYQFDSLISKETTAEDKKYIPEKPLDTVVKTAAKPSFKGGDEALMKFISNNLVYPKKALKNNIKCVVLVIFVINKDGSVTDVEAEQCEDESLKAEAIKVIELTNNLWNPGSQDGKPIKVRAKIPISFDIY